MSHSVFVIITGINVVAVVIIGTLGIIDGAVDVAAVDVAACFEHIAFDALPR